MKLNSFQKKKIKEVIIVMSTLQAIFLAVVISDGSSIDLVAMTPTIMLVISLIIFKIIIDKCEKENNK